MVKKQAIKLFEEKKVRTVWDDEEEKWYFCVVDVVEVLTDSANPQTYWRVLKNRLKKEGNETVTNCNALKLRAADGKMRLTYASLTDIITAAWSGRTTKQYKHLKGLHKENLRDNMTNVELLLNSLAEASATEISKKENPKGYSQNADVAKRGGHVAKAARNQLESQLGRSVVTSLNAKDYFKSLEQEEQKSIEQKADHQDD